MRIVWSGSAEELCVESTFVLSFITNWLHCSSVVNVYGLYTAISVTNHYSYHVCSVIYRHLCYHSCAEVVYVITICVRKQSGRACVRDIELGMSECGGGEGVRVLVRLLSGWEGLWTVGF